MATDDRRMHQGRSRSLDDRERGHERHEEQRGPGDMIGSGERTPADGPTAEVEEVSSTTDRDQESALGGHVGTRSGSAETPEDDKAG